MGMCLLASPADNTKTLFKGYSTSFKKRDYHIQLCSSSLMVTRCLIP